ncbi:MAG: carbon starvation protein A [Desulfovibrionaceae bacterium]
MNSLWVMGAAVLWFAVSYRVWGRRTERLAPPDDRLTPAHAMADGQDYYPGKRWLLWGNHFASIAGAGPIIGPILAVAAFGWGYTVLWVALGSVFLGAVHDYLTLMVSVRHQGKGVAELAGSALGPRVRLLFAAIIYCMLLMLVTAFTVSVAQAFVSVPRLVIPTFGLVGVAVLMGLAVYRLGMNDVLAGVLGVLAAYGLVVVGYFVPVSLPLSWGPHTVLTVWFLIISLYCLLASVAPIWLLLQPRDVLASANLFLGLGLGIVGVLVVHPVISAPFGPAGFVSGGKPVWPMLFIMVACGAISGFHAIVSSGTTSRQLARERDAKPVAFGGMLMEGLLAVLVVLVVSAGLTWGSAPTGTPRDLRTLYFANALAANWIVAFGNGFGNIVGRLGIPYLDAALAALLGATMVKSFVMTTLDSGTRLARFLVSDTLGRRVPLLRNRVVASLTVLVPAYLLAATDTYRDIWRMFGSANQLTAAVSLLVVAVWLGRERRPARYVLAGAAFMLLTVLAALFWEMFAPGTGFFTGTKPDYALGMVSLVLAGLALAAIVGAAHSLLRLHRELAAGDAGPA